MGKGDRILVHEQVVKLPTNCGFLYIAFGDKYVTEAAVSAQRLQRIHPDARIAIVADKAPDSNVFERVIIMESNRSYKDKVVNMQLSPYPETMFLDTDTYICEGICDVFGLLGYYDICMASELGRPFWKDLPPGLSELRECNTGVILFKRNARVRELFSNWERIYIERQDIDFHDQTSMAIALACSRVKFGLLPNEYNLRANHPQVLYRKVRIIHARRRNYLTTACCLNHPENVGRNWLPSLGKCVPIYGRGFTKAWGTFKKRIGPLSRRIRKALGGEGDLVMEEKSRFQD